MYNLRTVGDSAVGDGESEEEEEKESEKENQVKLPEVNLACSQGLHQTLLAVFHMIFLWEGSGSDETCEDVTLKGDLMAATLL